MIDWNLSEGVRELEEEVETDIKAALVAARESVFPDPESALSEVQGIGAPV